MLKNTVSLKHFSALLILLLITPMHFIELDPLNAKNRWIFELVQIIPGLLIIILYQYLINKYPGKNLSFILKDNFGKSIGNLVALFYVIYFIITANSMLTHFGSFMVTDVLNETPKVVIKLLFILLVCFGIYMGTEAIARSSQILAIVSVGSVLIILFLVHLTGSTDFQRLLPVMENGLSSVLNQNNTFRLVTRYEGLVALFLILFDTSGNKKNVNTAFLVIVAASLIRSYISFLGVAVLGDAVYMNTWDNVSILAETVDVGLIFERISGFAYVYKIIPLFIKLSIMVYAAVKLLSYIFTVNKERVFIIPASAVILLLSVLLAQNFVDEAIFDGTFLMGIFETIMIAGIPLLLVIQSSLRR